MAEQVASERAVELPGQSAGAACGRLVELAAQAGYNVAATAPGAYRLARTRRKMVVLKNVESATITVFEDRNGTKARVVGHVDDALLDHLIAAGRSLPMAGPEVIRTATEVRPAPSWSQASLPDAPSMPPSSPRPPTLPPAGGLIESPAWASSPSKPLPQPSAATPPAATVPHADDIDGMTIARSSIQRTRGGPSLTLPGGVVVDLATPVMIGRSPDLARAPAGAVAVPHSDRSLSKTHALVEASDGAIWITDLHSTNGSSVDHGGVETQLQPGLRTQVAAGAVIRLGTVDVVVNPS